MDPPPAAPGGLPWLYVGVMATFLAGGIAALWARLWMREKALGALLREKDAKIEAAERRADGQERAFREHLEHDLAIMQGTVRPPKAQHYTGDIHLDSQRIRAESISQALPPDVVARVREMIDRGEVAP